jgi:glycosyltransferase involved in cell wall biosynthesis
MKVLWFTNTPSLADTHLGEKVIGGGWIKSLEENVTKFAKVKLGIVFYSDKKIDYFKNGDTSYFPVFANMNSPFQRLYRRILAKLKPSSDIIIFKKIIEEYQPDIIHIHGTEGPFGLLQGQLPFAPPIVISIQGNMIACQNKYFSGIPKQKIELTTSYLEKILFKDISSGFRICKNRAERESRILKKSRNIIGRTDWDRRITDALAPGRIYFNNNEILRSNFYKYNWDKKLNSPIRIVTTTGSSLYKGFETILQAALLLDNLGFQYKWNIIGLGRDDRIIDVILRALSIPLSENIIFKGRLEEQQLINVLLDSHIYIMPSHIENSPNNLCEAMILGLPCIATFAGGTGSLLNNGEDGLLIQDGDPWSLAGSVLELANDFEKARSYGKNARKKGLHRHDPERIIKGLMLIYNKLIDKGTVF